MSEFKLKGGVKALTPLLGRVPEFDEKSRKFPVRKLIDTTKLKGRSWIVPPNYDQSIPIPLVQTQIIMRELGLRWRPWDPSACTGFSGGFDLISNPGPAKPADITPVECFKIYRLAQTLDEWKGENYEGSSVLGVCKALVKLGYVGEYRWAFGIEDVLLALAHVGPVVVGTDWQESMFWPKKNGLLRVEGDSRYTAGGHAYLVQSIIVNKVYKRLLLGLGEDIRDEPLLRIHQSWGTGWGRNGDCFMWASDMARLLKGISYPGEARITTAAYRRQR
jgi:hypothetical protein